VKTPTTSFHDLVQRRGWENPTLTVDVLRRKGIGKSKGGELGARPTVHLQSTPIELHKDIAEVKLTHEPRPLRHRHVIIRSETDRVKIHPLEESFKLIVKSKILFFKIPGP
jgi:hypothetical protein